jgi:hypothetical protein
MMHKTQALFMQWCLECHRAPEKFIRPRSEIFNMDWQPATLTAEQRAQLAEEYGLRKKGTTDCSTCHR